jgi:hypothetical protein
MNAPLLQTPLGAGRLLARPGDRRQWLLDARAAVLWDLHAQGLGAAALAELLTARFGLAPATALAQVANLLAAWHQAGLLGLAAVPPDCRTAAEVPPPARLTPLPGGAWRHWVADRAVGLGCTEAAFAPTLEAWFGPRAAAAGTGPVAHRLHLHGPPDAWRLTREGATLATGSGPDAALVATLQALTALGCTPARLLVLHGAGLRAPDGRGLLLVAPGGAGKSTLAAALDAAGFGLLSDDVVPVNLDGELLGLGLPLCLKAGSWPVLRPCRPDLASCPTMQRGTLPVRYLPPCTPVPVRPVTPARLLLVRYTPGHPPQCRPVSPEQALQGLLSAEAVVRDLTQAKLEAVAAWVMRLPSYQLSYPDLDSALEMIAHLPATPP